MDLKKRFSFGASLTFPLIMAAMFCMDVLPSLMCSVSMLITQDFISGIIVRLWEIAGLLLFFVLIFSAVVSYGRKEKFRFSYEALYYLADVAELIFFCVLFVQLTGTYALRFLQKYPQYYHQLLIVELALCAVIAVILPWFLFAVLTGQKISETGKGVFRRSVSLLIHPMQYAGWIILTAAFFLIPRGVETLFCDLLSFGGVSVASNIGRHLLCAFIRAGIFYLLLVTMNASAAKWKEKKEIKRRKKIAAGKVKETQERAEAPVILSKLRLVTAGLAVIGAAALLIAGVVISPTASVTEQIASEIAVLGAEGSKELLKEDFSAAHAYFEAACTHMNAWKAYAQGDDEALQSLAEEYPGDETVRYLSASLAEDITVLEDYVMRENDSEAMKQRLLEGYASAGGSELSGAQQERYKNLVLEMAASETFVREAAAVSDLRGEARELAAALEEFGILEADEQALSVLADSGYEGAVTDDMVETLLVTAEENPDDEGLQYLAGVYGASLKYDNAPHYERTVECLQRFDKLHDENDQYQEEDIELQKLTTAGLMMECLGYKEAAEVLDGITLDSAREEADNMLLLCYDRLEDYEKCYEKAVKAAENDSENLAAMFYRSLAALRLERPEESFEALFDLSAVIQAQDTEEETRMEAEALLYPLIEFATFNDSAGFTEFQCQYYDKLSEEQLAKLKEDSFLAAYMEAMYRCFGNKDPETAKEKIAEVLEICPDLPQALYLKGVIYAQEKEFDTAAVSYRQSLALNRKSAAAWYALANAYDALGEYQEAYDACVNAETLIAATDHNYDWYGVGIHNGRLKNKLELYLEEGK